MTAPTQLMNVILPQPVTWQIDSLVFNDRDAFGCEWVVDTETGWTGAAPPRTNRTARINAHGSYRSAVWRGDRTIALTGYCAAPDALSRRAAEQRIAAICADPDTLYTLRCNEESGPLVADVELDDEVQVKILHERWFTWSVQFAAPDPRKYALDEQRMSTGLAHDAGDGLDFAQIVAPDSEGGLFFGYGLDDDGLQFGTSNATGFMNLSNVGTAPTTPVYTITGPLTNPMLTTEFGSVRYNATLDEGEFVVIDPAAPSVLLGGVSSQRHLLNPAQFGAFSVPPRRAEGIPGVLSVGLTHTGPSTAIGQVTAVYRAAYF